MLVTEGWRVGVWRGWESGVGVKLLHKPGGFQHPLQTLSLYQLLSLCYPEPPILVATFFLHVEIGDAQRIPGLNFQEMKAFKNSIPPHTHTLTHSSLEL